MGRKGNPLECGCRGIYGNVNERVAHSGTEIQNFQPHIVEIADKLEIRRGNRGISPVRICGIHHGAEYFCRLRHDIGNGKYSRLQNGGFVRIRLDKICRIV